MRDRPPLPGPRDAATWENATVVVRGGIGGTAELAERLTRDGSWSVFSAPNVPFQELCRSVRNNRVRRTTVGAILAGGGSISSSPGPPHHCDLRGLTPERLDAILGLSEPNPIPLAERWKP